MARWLDRLRRDPSTPDASKAISPATVPAATYTSEQVAALVNASNAAGRQVTGAANPLPRLDPQVAFGPGMPLLPAAIDPVRTDTGRPEPRFNEYPVSSNLPGVTDRLVPWKVLRDAADAGGLPRRCIEIRKAEVTTLDWAITISKQAVEAAQQASDRPRAEVEGELRQRLSTEMTRCTRFWETPDRGQDEDFSEWLSKLLEEHLVLDAVAIYPRLTYGGDLYALEVLDASTIKVLRDHRGGRPTPPSPAFQQLLWGFPRGEFVADTDADQQVINGFVADQLIYKRRNVRAHTPYGYSPVEQALEDVDVWLRRRKWIRDEYTEGTVPRGWLSNNGTTSWTPAQLREYETEINDVYGGSLAARHRMRVMPPGFGVETETDVAERYKPEYDLFLVKQIAAHFDVTIAELGFTEQGGLGGAGWHEGQAEVQQRKGTLPTLRWLQQLLTSISRKHLRMPEELEFRFLGLEEEDAASADEVAAARVSNGRMTYNEDRDRLGMPRYDFPEADMPVVRTSRGLVFLSGASELAPAGENIGPVAGPAQQDKDADGVLDAPAGPDTDTDGTPADDAEDGDRAEAVKAELAAHKRWVRKNPQPTRPFTFKTVTKTDAPDLFGTPMVLFAATGADAGPKAGSPAVRPTWPGWGADARAVTYWTPRIRASMRAAVDTRRLAEQWIAERSISSKTDEANLSGVQRAGGDEAVIRTAHDTSGWLAAHGVDLTPALAVIADLHAEGHVIGQRSAGAVLAGTPADWSTWKPGSAQPINLPGTETTIRSVAATRTGKLGQALSGALDRGDNAAVLAKSLTAVLDDPAWARMLATTEISQGISTAASAAYRVAGVYEVTWLTSPTELGVCAFCLNNEAAGPIPIGDTFPSGDVEPPAHPNCQCVIYPDGDINDTERPLFLN